MAKSLITFSLTFILLANLVATAQVPEKQIFSREQIWLGALNQTRFSNHWGMWLDVNYRLTDNFVDRPFQFLLRAGATYLIKDDLRIHAGYVIAQHYPAKGLHTTRTEHRPWQQIWWNQNHSRLSILQWIRLEQRFDERIVADTKMDGYDYHLRLRYNCAITMPLKGKDVDAKTPFVAVANEIMLNFGDRIIYNTFDQNRLSVGIGYQFTSELRSQIGYMNIYQQQASGNSYFSTHVIRLSLAHSLDLRNKE